MMPVRLGPAAPLSRVKHSTTEPLCSLNNVSIEATSLDPDQTAPVGAVWSEVTLFVRDFLTFQQMTQKTAFVVIGPLRVNIGEKKNDLIIRWVKDQNF